MISNSVLLSGILVILLSGVFVVTFVRLVYKKSVISQIVTVITIPILNAVIMGLIIGAKGFIHSVWAAPWGCLLIIIGYAIIYRRLNRPLVEMYQEVESLSKGDFNISFNQKYLNGENEIFKVMCKITSLTESLKNVAVFAGHVGKGNLKAEYTLMGDNDHLGRAMLDMRSNLIKAETEKEERYHEDERRNWITHGVAKFAELLRANNDNIDELCQSIVSNLVKYIGANQAGIFILNDDDTANRFLELKACYAYERRKFLQKTAGLGEGLVGTCFLEGESIYMTKLPKNYINITSGLGDDAPSALLLTPLKINEDIYGIVEIAAFREFEPHVKEFVEKVAESIASTIGSVKVNMRTKKLLEQSKLQAEEMANQEEELRQNMEEMAATQEEMRRREADLQDVLAKSQESEKTFEEKIHWYEAMLDSFTETPISVTDMNKNITFLNQAALNILGTTRREAIGKYCGSVWNVDICNDHRCGIECMKRGEGKVVFNAGDATFTAYASYIKDLNGENVGHIEVVTNITELTQKSEYSKKEVEKLAKNVLKLAEGDLECDFTVFPPNQYTQEEYNNFNIIAADLKLVRDAVRKLTIKK